MSKLRVLVACEESQAVAIEFRKLGHEAYSCDIEPCSGGHFEFHIQQDVLPRINGYCKFKTVDGVEHEIDSKWDMLIAFPPCTYLSNAGAKHLFQSGQLNQERYQKGLEAKEFLCRSLMQIAHTLLSKILYPAEYIKCLRTVREFSRGSLGILYRKRRVVAEIDET